MAIHNSRRARLIQVPKSDKQLDCNEGGTNMRTLVFAALLPLTGLSVSGQPPNRITYADFTLEMGFFKCSAPAGWRRIRGERDDARSNSYGVIFEGPAGDEAVSPTVSVRYYGPGNSVAKDAGAFLDRQLRPGLVKLEGEQTSKPSETLLDGRKASAFTRSTYEMWPPHSIDSKRVPIKEETIVIQHEKGFFVLRFSATASSFKKWQSVFQHVRESFHVTG